MSMTKREFMRRYWELRSNIWNQRGYEASFDSAVAALAEEAGVQWAPEPTPEPAGDLSMVRVIDPMGYTWQRCAFSTGWIRLMDRTVEPWSEIPQPVTVLRPEGADRA